MNQLPQVVIVLARYSFARQCFGIRFEEYRSGDWITDRVFHPGARIAQHEGYDRSEITGTFSFAPTYPGCSFCQSTGIVRCIWGNVACLDGEQQAVICPWWWTSQTLEGLLRHLCAGGNL